MAWQSCDVQGPNCQIRAHHISATGTLLWSSVVQVTTIAGGKNGAHVLTDGSGGVVTFWTDCRNGTPSNCIAVQDIFAQRINAAGQSLWQADGYPVSAAVGNQGVDYAGGVSGVAVESDGQGGAILAWPDGRNQLCSASESPSRCDLFAQRIHY